MKNTKTIPWHEIDITNVDIFRSLSLYSLDPVHMACPARWFCAEFVLL